MLTVVAAAAAAAVSPCFSSGSSPMHVSAMPASGCGLFQRRASTRIRHPRLQGESLSSFSHLGSGKYSSGMRALRCASGEGPRVYKVEMEHEGKTHMLEVAEDETILEKALDEGLNVSHDCKLGVCMTCPAKLEKGKVNQSEGMLSEDVIDKGYALLCVSYPQSDCRIRTIPEDELVSLQLVTSSD